MFSSAGAQPISLKSFRGLGHFPNKIARVYKHEHCLPSAFRSWQVMRSGYRRALLARMVSSGVGTHRICLLFCKKIPVAPRRISQVYIHLLCLLFSVSHVSKRHFPNGNRRQPPPCLPKSETDGRRQWRRSRSSRPLTAFVRFATPTIILNEMNRSEGGLTK